ncbi:MAG: hypothetical protein IJC43_06085 [Clostridia bacterium]|nr:hypothetical protein [Clostridia bacterium]
MRQERGRRAGGARVTARARTAAPRPSADLKEMMSRLEQSLGPEAAASVRSMGSPERLQGMLDGLSEKDMARLEGLMQNPDRLKSLLTPDNLRRLRDTLEG